MLKQIGKYTISERIGRGTYSRVYRAVDPQGRPVAIKVSTTRTELEHLNEFQKDLVAAASVLHPNLVAVHDLGFEDDFPYLVMELVDGQDLDKLLKSDAAPSLAERIRVMQQIGGALQSAHERGVYHLDLRPSKIMLAEGGTAKLLDLGLGRLSFDPARVTENGYLLGAPFYMSPERLTAIDTANERCDIWSFGVTFHEWISGRHPFYDDDGERMIGNIMDADPAELSDVPAPLQEAILRALEKDPADRYQNFGDLLADLKPLVSDLRREESDALMAEALKQTDSGRWHEARRIARKMRDLDPKQSPSSQLFGFSEQEAEQTRPVAPVVASPVQPFSAAASVSASTATAVETPEPEPPPVERPAPVVAAAAEIFTAEAITATDPAPQSAAPALPLPRPQRPERTPPKIPTIGVRNASPAAAENGSAATARVRPATAAPVSNGVHVAAATAEAASLSGPALVREMEPGLRAEPTRSRPPSNPLAAAAPPAPTIVPVQSTVRILEMEEPRGFPWVKIFSFSVPALLMIGLLLFFLRPASKFLQFSTSSEEAKQISPASRVIKGDRNDSSDNSTPELSSTGQPAVLTTVPVVNGQPGATGAVPSSGDPLDGAAPTAPRTFDPKSLVIAKPPTPNRRRNNGEIVGVAAPSLGGNNAEVPETGPLTAALNVPPPPSPSPAAVSPTPAAATQTSESHTGGGFVQPVLMHTVQPTYPPNALQTKTQGTVRFQATIAKDGSVKNLQLLSGDPLLNLAAKQAVLQWKYQPAMLNGQPIEVTQAIVVKFNLNAQ